MVTRFNLTGSVADFSANTEDAIVIVTPSVAYVKDTVGNVLIRGVVVKPVEGGAFTISLPATNDVTLDPYGFVYTALIKFADGSTIQTVEFSLTGHTNLLTVTPAAASLVFYMPGIVPHDHNADYAPLVHTHDVYLTQAEGDLLYAAIGAGGGAGTPGTAGSKWLSGAGAPAGGTGVVTDWYLNTTNYDIHEKTGAAVWTARGNLKGIQGIQGLQGNPGADSTVAGPQGIQGNPGADSVVPGPQGLQGIQGNPGADSTVAGPQGIQGIQGVIGNTGPGVAIGGTAGQILSKINATDYNTQWIDAATGSSGWTVVLNAVLVSGVNNITHSNNSLVLAYRKNGLYVELYVRLVVDSNSQNPVLGAASWAITMPAGLASSNIGLYGNGHVLPGSALDYSTGIYYSIVGRLEGSTLRFMPHGNATIINAGTNPFTAANNDVYVISGLYTAAA